VSFQLRLDDFHCCHVVWVLGVSVNLQTKSGIGSSTQCPKKDLKYIPKVAGYFVLKKEVPARPIIDGNQRESKLTYL
jgi:hypothetical protein